MSITQTSTGPQNTDTPRCPHCHSALPAGSTFCGVCGERVTIDNDAVQSAHLLAAAERYRFTSLVRRRPAVQLFLANDIQTQRPVAIRDIDISSLPKDAIEQAIQAVQQEYDLLRRHSIPDLMPVIDLRYHEGHIFVVSSWPFAIHRSPQDHSQVHLQTLQDLLQSGVGLPDEQVALIWMYRICRALDRLHNLEIVLGDLDPYAILVSETGYDGLAALMISWLPANLRPFLPASSQSFSPGHFTAPEAQQGMAEPGSDLYSLGAILYLLLTGTAPELAAQRMTRPLRTVREINGRISSSTSAIVMRALALDPQERYQNAGEMAKALLQVCANQQLHVEDTEQGEDETALQDTAEEVTISIVPLQARLARWQLSQLTREPNGAQPVDQGEEGEVPSPLTVDAPVSTQPLPEPLPRTTNAADTTLAQQTTSPLQRFRQQLSGVLPALKRPKHGSEQQGKEAPAEETSFLKRLQRFILGEQQRSTTAAALIETPLRVQPEQGYNLRIHLTGRDEQVARPGKRGVASAGLSALVQGEMVHIEVRSALYQNYAYIVQRADVVIPGRGYAAEVSIPMQALSSGAGGRRERLHIFFSDELRHPLYEKPFVVEVFVSPLVQSGREGYNVIPIPL